VGRGNGTELIIRTEVKANNRLGSRYEQWYGINCLNREKGG
jgi:hypothetical protein